MYREAPTPGLNSDLAGAYTTRIVAEVRPATENVATTETATGAITDEAYAQPSLPGFEALANNLHNAVQEQPNGGQPGQGQLFEAEAAQTDSDQQPVQSGVVESLTESTSDQFFDPNADTDQDANPEQSNPERHTAFRLAEQEIRLAKAARRYDEGSNLNHEKRDAANELSLYKQGLMERLAHKVSSAQTDTIDGNTPSASEIRDMVMAEAADSMVAVLATEDSLGNEALERAANALRRNKIIRGVGRVAVVVTFAGIAKTEINTGITGLGKLLQENSPVIPVALAAYKAINHYTVSQLQEKALGSFRRHSPKDIDRANKVAANNKGKFNRFGSSLSGEQVAALMRGIDPDVRPDKAFYLQDAATLADRLARNTDLEKGVRYAALGRLYANNELAAGNFVDGNSEAAIREVVKMVAAELAGRFDLDAETDGETVAKNSLKKAIGAAVLKLTGRSSNQLAEPVVGATMASFGI